MFNIIGCGNLNRCDDAVGIIIAKELQQFLVKQPHPHVHVYDCGTAGMEVMFQARGSKKLIIIDASHMNCDAGAIFKIPGKELATQPKPSYNLHDFRWDNALAVGKEIFKDEFPQDITVYLIEAANLGFGWELTPAVKDAADSVVAEITNIIKNHV